MKFLATAVALASNAGAAAIGRNPPTCPSKYVLKTEPLPGSANLLHSGLYLYASHTGAGLYDPVFDVNKTVGSVGQLDNGHQAFDVGTNTAELSMMYAPYAAWAGVAMNLGDGDSGYYLNENGLQWTSSPESPGGSTDSFKGWLVCDWYHGAPQLFWRISGYEHTTIPSSCAPVLLKPEAI
ncbi:unnamed protein product [Zymoseptoria tritici ST99CH_3D1]|uniref:DUF7907 domain-containing protein n=2 Tax=Zymoseptoria tritici TaxID=1047171 RepID=F9XIX7_ZYMTI|nr:uncharacterized protein MYCGRDRAFT_95788 [Zymoseptoria tritici IPO323]EGP84648.1 hypothetical protein MYCGRDRAFT_95788 [Zymoseptoria tritici IPO323]SMQ54151.1 unnamed protein product [Zymoseptoria tritici ST99CH_3D7]SMR61577.1 unnamed protein product [Zymoseptoria tritici ST99CH_3D1]